MARSIPRFRRPRRIPPLLLSAVAAAVLAGCAAAPAPAPPAPAPPAPADRDATALRMVQLVRAGRLEEARAAVRDFTAAHPRDGTMLYNLACLDLMAEDRDTALATLETALAAGYSNFRLMEKDRSLSPLRDDPRYLEMVDRYESALRDTFESRALLLEAGYPVVDVPLHAADGGPGPEARLTVAYDRDALHVDVAGRDPAFSWAATPWEGGSGLLIHLIRPIGLDDYESRRYHAVALGLDQGEPRAWLVSVDGDRRREPLPEAAPILARDGDAFRWRASIPWDVFHPYGPPLDLEMGLNVIVLRAGGGSTRLVAALMPEARPPWEGDPWRRYVPVQFLDSDRSRPSARARISNRLVEGEAVALEAGAWCAVAGEARWTLEVLPQGRSDEPATSAVTRLWACAEGFNFDDTTVDVAALPTGLYRLRARCALPDGDELTLDEPFYRLREDDMDDLNRRLHELGGPRAELVRYHLFVFARDLDRRHPLDPVDDLDAEFRRIAGLVDDLEAGRPVLPEAGPFLGGFNVDTMVQRSCAMHLPPGWRERRDLRLLVVVPPGPGQEEELARAVGSRRDDLVVLVPQSHGATGLDLDRATRHTATAVDWARELFGVERVALAGLGAGADAALAAALGRPDLVSALLLEVDGLFAVETGPGPERLEELIAASPPPPPTLLVAAAGHEESLAAVAAALRSRGGQVVGGVLEAGTPVAAWLADATPR